MNWGGFVVKTTTTTTTTRNYNNQKKKKLRYHLPAKVKSAGMNAT